MTPDDARNGSVDWSLLFDTEDIPALDDSERSSGMSVKRVRAVVDRLVVPLGQLSSEARDLIESIALLWHDHLDASHTISQRIESAEGSYAHGMMHRREGDYWNSKYWMRRAQGAFFLNAIGDALRGEFHASWPSEKAPHWLGASGFDAEGFVDACASAVKDTGATGERMRRLQAVEFLAVVRALSSTR